MEMITIELMSKTDIKGVQDVAITSWHDTYQDIIPLEIQDQFLNYAYSEEMLLKRLSNSYFLVAKIDDNIEGFINISKRSDNEEYYLSALYVNPQTKNRGIGTQLMNQVFKDHPFIKKMTLDVEKDNENAFNFYSKKGFKVVKEYKEDLLGHTLNTIEMVLIA